MLQSMGSKDLDVTERLNSNTGARHCFGSFTEPLTWDCAQRAPSRTGMRLTSVGRALPAVGKEIHPLRLPVTTWPAVVQPLRNPVADQICPGAA